MNNLLSPFSEIAQQLELAVRQVYRRIVGARAQRPEVDDQLPDQEALQRGMRAAQHRADARQQLLEVERLRDVIVCAELQPFHLVYFLATRRQNNDGNFA